MARDRDDEDRIGLDLPVEPLEDDEDLGEIEVEFEEADRAATSAADPGTENMPGGETGISRRDAPAQ